MPLLGSAIGEIGNNSFDHNIGKWPDVPGIFFGVDIVGKRVVLADRGLGILETLRYVRPDLRTHSEAIKVAFTEVVSGRAPEKRGNGLKLVRKIATLGAMSLSFQTGDAILDIKAGTAELLISKSDHPIKGCLAVLEY